MGYFQWDTVNQVDWIKIALPVDVHGVSTLRFAFGREVHEHWSGVQLQL